MDKQYDAEAQLYEITLESGVRVNTGSVTARALQSARMLNYILHLALVLTELYAHTKPHSHTHTHISINNITHTQTHTPTQTHTHKTHKHTHTHTHGTDSESALTQQSVCRTLLVFHSECV